MHPVIHFRSRLFDTSLEPDNPINPIRGRSVLEWFRARVAQDLSMSAPDAEDWGWYSHVDWQGRTYMVGACANEHPDGNHEWIVQFDKSRSLKERVLGRAGMTADDPCLLYFKGLLANEPAFTNLFLEQDA